ncbi:MAG: aminotransferase class V-fold PLP-dependent enzyme, partial [Erysipelotrichia bacterium]|nr:aminotransferase class V-fold PLP-dependent enzyme [Erysipelotrichia bacterium]
FHVDIVQAIGKVPIALDNVDLFSLTGHKIHGLPGSGLLIKKRQVLLKAHNIGGGQENNYRSGTNTLALSAAIAKALRLVTAQQKDNYRHVTTLRDRLWRYLNDNPHLYKINSFFKDNPYIVNFSLLTRKASVVVEALSNRQIMVSSVSSCHSKKEKFSAVIYAMYHDETLAQNTIRVSFCKENTLEEVDELIKGLDEIIEGLKQ